MANNWKKTKTFEKIVESKSNRGLKSLHFGLYFLPLLINVTWPKSKTHIK